MRRTLRRDVGQLEQPAREARGGDEVLRLERRRHREVLAEGGGRWRIDYVSSTVRYGIVRDSQYSFYGVSHLSLEKKIF